MEKNNDYCIPSSEFATLRTLGGGIKYFRKGRVVQYSLSICDGNIINGVRTTKYYVTVVLQTSNSSSEFFECYVNSKDDFDNFSKEMNDM